MKGEIKTLCFKPMRREADIFRFIFFKRPLKLPLAKKGLGWEALEDGGRKEGNTMVQERDRES